ncbi:MAG: hypothetical protein Q8927_08845 [Bacteroidota bacterium]|nr:hypothetical protein [Bacteroidota bacterium]MDP4216297.1 hypothetical protein [Bacteroidota bacterium]MDP4244462.1 hypothetical protein [Bacteroidota bacterium]MDP4258190.1 hypothetical protein [Bacteroidota bacterium]
MKKLYLYWMDRYGLRKEILALVDGSPLADVELQPLIEKYTAGMNIPQQQEARNIIRTMLQDLKQGKEIDYSTDKEQFLGLLSHGEFASSSILIRSTGKRQDEIEKRNETTRITQHIQNIGENYGIANQDSSLSRTDFRPIQNPPTAQTIHPAKHGAKTSFGRFITNPIVQLIALVIVGLIVAYFTHLFGWNDPK